jgi:hypothetical protein
VEYWNSAIKKGYSGTAIFAKKEPIAVKMDLGKEEHSMEGRVITLEYDNFYLVNAYAPNSQRGLVRLDYRMDWQDDFLAYLRILDQRKPVVICGDLNVAHKEIDLKNPKSNVNNAGFSPQERANDISSAYKWFAKRGNITVFICRFVPIVRSLISIPAGTAKMNFGVFLMLTLLGTAIWNTVLVVLGSFAGEAWESVLVYIDRYSTIALIALLLVILLAVFRFYRHKVNRK